MNIVCPECGSADVRASLSRSLAESIAKVFGFFHFRCRQCDARFSGQIWDLGNIFWTKCPRCYRMDLTTWDPGHYHCPVTWRVLMRLGAKCIRCEYCRNNFVSFRRAKYKFVRRKMSDGPSDQTAKKSTLR